MFALVSYLILIIFKVFHFKLENQACHVEPHECHCKVLAMSIDVLNSHNFNDVELKCPFKNIYNCYNYFFFFTHKLINNQANTHSLPKYFLWFKMVLGRIISCHSNFKPYTVMYAATVVHDWDDWIQIQYPVCVSHVCVTVIYCILFFCLLSADTF